MITTVIIASIISCVGMLQVLAALSRKQRERLLRHRGKVNLFMHVAIFYVFMGTVTGLIQAELCAILLTICFAAVAKKAQLDDKRQHAFAVASHPKRITRSEMLGKL